MKIIRYSNSKSKDVQIKVTSYDLNEFNAYIKSKNILPRLLSKFSNESDYEDFMDDYLRKNVTSRKVNGRIKVDEDIRLIYELGYVGYSEDSAIDYYGISIPHGNPEAFNSAYKEAKERLLRDASKYHDIYSNKKDRRGNIIPEINDRALMKLHELLSEVEKEYDPDNDMVYVATALLSDLKIALIKTDSNGDINYIWVTVDSDNVETGIKKFDGVKYDKKFIDYMNNNVYSKWKNQPEEGILINYK